MSAVISAIAIIAATPIIIAAAILVTVLQDIHANRLGRLERQWMADYRRKGSRHE